MSRPPPLRVLAAAAVAALLALGGCADAQGETVTTIAGGGTSDGFPGVAVRLYSPVAAAVDGNGNLLIAETGSNRVRQLAIATGIITTAVGDPAGNGTWGFDFGSYGTMARSSGGASDVAVDRAGNVYIAKTNRHHVVRLSPSTGVIAAVAGSDQWHSEWGFGGDGGPATSALLDYPTGVALDAGGNLFIADYFNNRIRRVAFGMGIITTVAGRSTAGFSGDGGRGTSASLNAPFAVAVDGGGHLFIADTGNARIRRLAAGTGIITTVAGTGAFRFSGDGGPGTSASLHGPQGVAVDGGGNVLIAETAGNRIRRLAASTGIITTVAGNGTRGFNGDGGLGTASLLAGPQAVAVDAGGNVFIVDHLNLRIRRLATDTGIMTTVIGNGGFDDGQPATSAVLNSPDGVAVHPNGDVFFADKENFRICKLDASSINLTVVVDFLARPPFSIAGPEQPSSMAFDHSGNLFFADRRRQRIRRLAAGTGIITTVAGIDALDEIGDGAFIGDGGPATSAILSSPMGVTVDGGGNLLIADTENNRIRRVAAGTGIITTVAGGPWWGGSWWSWWLSDRPIGDGGPATNATLHEPYGVAVDASGNLFIADTRNDRIRRVAAGTGIITTVAGNSFTAFGYDRDGDGGPGTSASLRRPYGIVVDGGGNVLFSEMYTRRIRRVAAATGYIETVAGSTYSRIGLDLLGIPQGIAVNSNGTVFVADAAGHRLLRVTLASPSALPTRAPPSSSSSPRSSPSRTPSMSRSSAAITTRSLTRSPTATSTRLLTATTTRSRAATTTRSRTATATRSRTATRTRTKKPKLA
jgi:sugar lactone lactonase YvrE